MTTKEYDTFFEDLRTELVPFVLTATSGKKPLSRRLTKNVFPLYKQKKFNMYLADVLKFDLKHGVVRTSNHQFTSNFSSFDVSIATRYIEYSIESAIFSTIDKMRHGIYEQYINPA